MILITCYCEKVCVQLIYLSVEFANAVDNFSWNRIEQQMPALSTEL